MEFEALSSEARCSEPDIRSGRGGLGGGILEFDEPGGLWMIVLMVQNWSRILLHKSRAIARRHSYLCFFCSSFFSQWSFRSATCLFFSEAASSTREADHHGIGVSLLPPKGGRYYA